MRKALIGLLMAATAATPVLAQEADSPAEARNQARAERAAGHYERVAERNQERYEQRQERVEQRQQRVEQRQEQPRYERVERQQSAPAPVQAAEAQRNWQGRSGGGDWQRGNRGDRRSDAAQQQAQQTEQTRSWGGRDGRNDAEREAFRRRIEESRQASQRSAEGLPANYQRQAQRNERNWERDQWRNRSDGRRDGWQGRDGRNSQWSDNPGSYDGRHRDWSRDWRRDNRYDWQRYRQSNRSIFHFGSYYSPYRGYRYQRLSIGLVLNQLFYSDRYWLNDPWQYRLPPAPYGTRWVRYYDDVLLVDLYTGEVVDVIYDFFW